MAVTTQERTAREARIKDIVCEILEIEPEDVGPTDSFKDDHDADSLRAIEILAALEREFGIEIPQQELGRMTDLQAVHAVVAEHAGWDD